MDDPFYIGYQPKAPAATRRAVYRFLPVVCVLLVFSAVLLSRAQSFDASLFEFGDVGEFTGTYHAKPVPLLISDEGPVLMLVGEGKHGAELTTETGSRIRIQGTRIVRGASTMIEVKDGSAVELAPSSASAVPMRIGPVEMSGEIVGSKCFLGVMNPGRGPVHRACARHCIRGGVPAMLYSRNESGSEVRTLLTGLEADRFAAMAALPVSVTGVRWVLGSLEWVEVVRISEGGT